MQAVPAEFIRRFDRNRGYETSFRPMVNDGRGKDESHETLILTPPG